MFLDYFIHLFNEMKFLTPVDLKMQCLQILSRNNCNINVLPSLIS